MVDRASGFLASGGGLGLDAGGSRSGGWCCGLANASSYDEPRLDTGPPTGPGSFQPDGRGLAVGGHPRLAVCEVGGHDALAVRRGAGNHCRGLGPSGSHCSGRIRDLRGSLGGCLHRVGTRRR